MFKFLFVLYQFIYAFSKQHWQKTFNIRTTKYDTLTYYHIYTLLITVLKNLFDVDLFIKNEITINYKEYKYYTLNKELYNEYITIMNNFDNNIKNIEFIYDV